MFSEEWEIAMELWALTHGDLYSGEAAVFTIRRKEFRKTGESKFLGSPGEFVSG